MTRDTSGPYPGGRLQDTTATTGRAGVELLRQHLVDAAAIFAVTPSPDLDTHTADVSADLNHLPWFDMPAGGVRPA